jgi:hypothetical protein
MRFMRVDVQAIYDERSQQKIRARYSDDIRQLNRLGFVEEIYLEECMPPFSLIYAFPLIALGYSMGIMTWIRNPLRATSPGIGLINAEGYICGSPTSTLGMQYLTWFDDATLLMSCAKGNTISSYPKHRFHTVTCRTHDPAQMLEQHTQEVERFVSPWRNVIAPLGLSEVIAMVLQMNNAIWGGTPYINEKTKKKKSDS